MTVVPLMLMVEKYNPVKTISTGPRLNYYDLLRCHGRWPCFAAICIQAAGNESKGLQAMLAN